MRLSPLVAAPFVATLCSLTTALLLAPQPAAAGEGCGDGFSVAQHIFETADTDHDGVLTPGEYARAGLERYGVSFEGSDANADGETSLQEYLDLYDRHHPPSDGSTV